MARSYTTAGDTVNCGSAASLDNLRLQGGGGMSVALWIKINESTADANHQIAVKGNATNGWNVSVGRIGTNPWLFYAQHKTDATELVQVTSHVYSENVWYQLAVTWDGTLNESGMKIYISGAEVSYDTASNQDGTGNFASDASFDLKLGDNTDNAIVVASLAEVAVWNVVLTPNEAISLYRMSPLLIRPSAIKGYWPLFGTTSPEPDWSGNANHGTVTATARVDHAPVNYMWPSTRVQVARAVSSTDAARNLRRSMVAHGLPWMVLGPIPDGTID